MNRKEFISLFEGQPKNTFTDLNIIADDNVGFSYSFQHITGTDKQGHTINRAGWVTDSHCKIGEQWLIPLAHVGAG